MGYLILRVVVAIVKIVLLALKQWHSFFFILLDERIIFFFSCLFPSKMDENYSDWQNVKREMTVSDGDIPVLRRKVDEYNQAFWNR